MKFRHTLTATAAALLVAAPAASAHVTVSTDNTTAGGYAIVAFNVPHGCEGSPTTKIEVQLPEGTQEFKPEISPLWDAKVTSKQAPDGTKAEDGDAITELPSVATWTFKQPVPDANLVLLRATMNLPKSAGQVNFPVVQTCSKGSVSWTEIQKAGADEPEHPAPSFMVTEGSGDDGHSSMTSEASEDSSSTMKGDAASTKQVDDAKDDADQAKTFGIVGIALGAVGLLFGLIGLRRRR